MSPATASTSQNSQLSYDSISKMLRAEIAAAAGMARSAWWDAHSDATQATVKNLKLQWKFSAKYHQFPNGDRYHPVSMLPTTLQQWNVAEIQNCITALQKGDLVAVPWEPDLTPEDYSEALSSVKKSASLTNSRNGTTNSGSYYCPRSDTTASVETTSSPARSSNKDPITLKYYQRVMGRLRTLLKTATGYNLRSKQHAQILYDNPSGHAAYKWNFTDYFRAFPPNPPSKWTSSQCRYVEDALNNGWLSVTALAGPRNSDSPTPERISTRPPRTAIPEENPFPPSHQPPPPIPTAPNANNRQISTQPEEPIPTLLAALNRDITSAYDRTITSVTTTLLASASTQQSFLSSTVERLSAELASQRSKDHSEISSPKAKVAAAQSHGAREAELAQARAEGDVAGRERVMMEIRDTKEKLQREYLEELVRVRREARMEGYEAGFRAGVEQREMSHGGIEKTEMGNGVAEARLGSLFSEEETEVTRQSEEYNPEAEFGFQRHPGIIGGRHPVPSGENHDLAAEVEDQDLGAGEYNAEFNIQYQPYMGIVEEQRPEWSELKHTHDADGELYDATPPRAFKQPKFEKPAERKVRGTVNKKILHKGPFEGLAQSFTGGLFLSSDEEIDDGMRELPLMGVESGFSFY